MNSSPPAVKLSQALQAALKHLQAGSLPQAEAICRQILKADPRNAAALQFLGAVALARNDYEAATAWIEKSLAVNPQQPQALNNLGTAYQKLGRVEEAIGAYRRALALNPDYPSALNNLGVLLAERGELEEALACCERACRLRPEDGAVHLNLGNVLKRLGRTGEALAAYRRAVELRPASAEAHNNLGTALQQEGNLSQALACYRRALELNPDFPEAYFNLGNALRDERRLDQAIAAYSRALALRPGYAEARDGLLHQMQRICDWSRFDELWAAHRAAVESDPNARVSPFSLLALPSTAAEQLRCARNWARIRLDPVSRLRSRLGFSFAPSRHGKLRVGYLSGDFRDHAVARLIAGLFELHDRKRFEIRGYSFGPDDGSDIRARIVRACDGFTDISALSFEEAARRLFDDGVNILIDLAGYTQHCRTEILALRPAPIQVNYLGFAGTLGTDFHDYIITDRFITPPASAAFYTEKFVYLPCFQVNDHRRRAAAMPSRAGAGLPEDAFVFCCFAQPFKILPPVFDTWMRILKAVPGSLAWLLDYNPWSVQNLRREAQARGVAPERLIFAALRPHEEYLALLPLADLFLDTLPYNAHTSTSEALWAGLPVLTCAGETQVSRVAGSLLTAVGLTELITGSLAEYEAKAIELARRPREIARLREKLVQVRADAALFDTGRFARTLERAYEIMWERFLAGRPPDVIDLSAP